MGQLGAAGMAHAARMKAKADAYWDEYSALADEMGDVAAAAIRGSLGKDGGISREEADKAYARIYARLIEMRPYCSKSLQFCIDTWIRIAELS